MKRRPKPKYFVLDQNVVSDPGVVGPLHAEHRRSRQRIVLSPSSRYEMTKGGLEGFLKDVSQISKVPAVRSGKNTEDMVAEREIETGDGVRRLSRADRSNLRVLWDPAREPSTSEVVDRERAYVLAVHPQLERLVHAGSPRQLERAVLVTSGAGRLQSGRKQLVAARHPTTNNSTVATDTNLPTTPITVPSTIAAHDEDEIS